MEENREAVEGYWQALENEDYEAAQAQLHGEFVEEWPQSGERIRGRVNWMRVIMEHPTRPSFRTRRIIGRDDLWVAEVLFDYAGSGSPPYHVCAIMECRDGKIWRLTEFFGGPFDPADWRAGFAERMDG
jgi:ketosteroid isomerase-like protein